MTSILGINTVGLSSNIIKLGILLGWFIILEATEITNEHNGAMVLEMVGLLPTTATPGFSKELSSNEKSSHPKIHINSGVFICATAPCNVPTTPAICSLESVSTAVAIEDIIFLTSLSCISKLTNSL